MSQLEEAIRIAVEAHHGQRDKVGMPYILHPLRMMLRQKTEPAMMAAVLHDVVEDTPWTPDRLAQRGIPREVLDAVDCLTRRGSETYEQFIERVLPNAIARAVKLADLEDNMTITRLDGLGEKELERLRRYHQAWRVLMAAEEKAGRV